MDKSIVGHLHMSYSIRNDPNRHPYVNDVERTKIARGRDALDALAQKHVPYR